MSDPTRDETPVCRIHGCPAYQSDLNGIRAVSGRFYCIEFIEGGHPEDQAGGVAVVPRWRYEKAQRVLDGEEA